MIAILKVRDEQIVGWILASDLNDAKNRALSAMQVDLHNYLNELDSIESKMEVEIAGCKHILLAQP